MNRCALFLMIATKDEGRALRLKNLPVFVMRDGRGKLQSRVKVLSICLHISFPHHYSFSRAKELQRRLCCLEWIGSGTVPRIQRLSQSSVVRNNVEHGNTQAMVQCNQRNWKKIEAQTIIPSLEILKWCNTERGTFWEPARKFDLLCQAQFELRILGKDTKNWSGRQKFKFRYFIWFDAEGSFSEVIQWSKTILQSWVFFFWQRWNKTQIHCKSSLEIFSFVSQPQSDWV